MTSRRLRHGGSNGPTLRRPGNGYGRPTRPGPAPSWNLHALAWRRSDGREWDFGELLVAGPPLDSSSELTGLPPRRRGSRVPPDDRSAAS